MVQGYGAVPWVGYASEGKLRCPACGYPVFNLPAVHDCPECGFACDPLAKVYVLPHAHRRLLWLLGIWPMLLIVLPWARLRGLGMDWAAVGVGIAVLMTVTMLVRAVWCARRRKKLYVNHRGIWLGHGEWDAPHVSWADFGKACWGPVTGELCVLDRQDRLLLSCGQGGIGGRGGTRRIAEDLNRLAERYGQENRGE
ncbi:MAG: hypothetical protein GXY55_03545 [Phycisphaerae bacterium]|nr:hypothetical protein [Phycisphaerae bacterium]